MPFTQFPADKFPNMDKELTEHQKHVWVDAFNAAFNQGYPEGACFGISHEAARAAPKERPDSPPKPEEKSYVATAASLQYRRLIPVRTVVSRPLKRIVKPAKTNGHSANSANSLKSASTDNVLKTLSDLKKSVIKTEQACLMAEQDLEDVRYANADSVQSAYESIPRVMKSLESIRSAQELMHEASECIEMAKKAIRGEIPTNDSQAVAADAGTNVAPEPTVQSGSSVIPVRNVIPVRTVIRRTIQRSPRHRRV